MNRRGFLRSLALGAAAVALGRSMGEPVVETLAPKTSPLFKGEMGVYNGVTIHETPPDVLRMADIERLLATLDREAIRPVSYTIVLPASQYRSFKRHVRSGGVRFRKLKRLREGSWA